MGDQPAHRRSGTVQTPLDPEDTGVHHTVDENMSIRMRRQSIATDEVKSGLTELRADVKNYMQRDLDEHIEIRKEHAVTRERIHELNTSTAGLATAVAVVGVKLDTFIGVVTTQLVEKVKIVDAVRTDGLSQNDFKRKTWLVVMGVVAGIIGALAHHFLS